MKIKNVLNYFRLRGLRKKLDEATDRYNNFWEDFYNSGIVIERGSTLNNVFTKTEQNLSDSIKSLEQSINKITLPENAN